MRGGILIDGLDGKDIIRMPCSMRIVFDNSHDHMAHQHDMADPDILGGAAID